MQWSMNPNPKQDKVDFFFKWIKIFVDYHCSLWEKLVYWNAPCTIWLGLELPNPRQAEKPKSFKTENQYGWHKMAELPLQYFMEKC